MEALVADAWAHLDPIRDAGLRAPAHAARAAIEHAVTWLRVGMNHPTHLEAGARRGALTLGRSLELAYLCSHAQWCLDHQHGTYAAAAARRLAHHGVDLIDDLDAEDTLALAGNASTR